jgi:hypothetical protein
MSKIDWSDLKPKPRKPTRKEAATYRRWVTYLSDSRLSKEEIYKRAAEFTEKGMKPDV